MTKSKRRRLRASELALSVGSLLASLGASLGVVPDHALAQSASTDTSTTASASTTSSNAQQAAITTSAQQAMYQREAAWRGDGTQSLASMQKGAPNLPLPPGLTHLEQLDETNRRVALLNQGMTLADLQKADAALQAEAAARAQKEADPAAAQQRILQQLIKAQIVDYDFSTSSSAQRPAAGGPLAAQPITPYELMLKQVMPTAIFGKTPIDVDTDMEVKKRVDMMKSGMSYQQVVDAEAQQDAKLQAKAAQSAPNDPAQQKQILQQLRHDQLVQYLWDHLPPNQHYQFLLDLIAKEPPGGLTPIQLETEAVKRMTMLNGGMSYLQVLAALDAERQAIQLMALAAAMLAQQQDQTSSSSQTTSTNQAGGGTTTQGQPTGSTVIVSTNTNTTARIFICK